MNLGRGIISFARMSVELRVKIIGPQASLMLALIDLLSVKASEFLKAVLPIK